MVIRIGRRPSSFSRYEAELSSVPIRSGTVQSPGDEGPLSGERGADCVSRVATADAFADSEPGDSTPRTANDVGLSVARFGSRPEINPVPSSINKNNNAQIAIAIKRGANIFSFGLLVVYFDIRIVCGD